MSPGSLARASPWAVLLAGAAAGVIMACFAEVASQFTRRAVLIFMLAPHSGACRNRNGLDALAGATGRACGYRQPVRYLLWRVLAACQGPLSAISYSDFLYGVLTLINYRGVRASTQVSNVFTVAKLVPLFLVAIAGSFYLLTGHKAAPVLPGGAGGGAWLKACLLLVFAYGGFETASLL